MISKIFFKYLKIVFPQILMLKTLFYERIIVLQFSLTMFTQYQSSFHRDTKSQIISHWYFFSIINRHTTYILNTNNKDKINCTIYFYSTLKFIENQKYNTNLLCEVFIFFKPIVKSNLSRVKNHKKFLVYKNQTH